MSYAFSFVATSKEKALTKLAEIARLQPNFAGMPYQLAAEAVVNVPDRDDLGFHVVCSGHQCKHAGDYATSQHAIMVEPITVD